MLAPASAVGRTPSHQSPFVILWTIVGVLLLGAALWTPMSRTQEARVLATGREMIEADWGGWLIPHLNGQPRLEKPPLAYWLSAGSLGVANSQ